MKVNPSIARFFNVESPNAKIALEQGWLTANDPRIMNFFSEYEAVVSAYEPVSYTHLDVYKRQRNGQTENGESGTEKGQRQAGCAGWQNRERCSAKGIGRNI